MNLKRLRGIMAAALTGLAVALIAGCSNSMAGSVDGGETRMATLSISATGIPNDYAEQFAKSYPNATRNVAARSITPDKPYTPTDTGLVCYLTGTSETGKKLNGADAIKVKPTQVGTTNEYTLEADDGGTGIITLPSMSWNLVLTVYKTYTNEDNNEPVLQGFCSVDLRNGSGTAKFTLSPENLDTSGSVKITGDFSTYDNVASYTMGIYKKNSASEVVDYTTETVAAGTISVDFTYTCASVAPGSYLYKMVFNNADGTTTGSFIDTLIVDAGNALNRNIGTLDVVNKKPGAPTGFNASLVKGSESADGTYKVRLNWGSGGGETNFEVELTEYVADGTADTDVATGYPKIYGMASMDKDNDGNAVDGVIDFQGSDVWAGDGGAMTYGDTEAYLKLKLGVVYEVRIRARNYVGTSAAVETDWTTRTVAGTTDTKLEGYADDKKINRMKIEYNLNGGTLGYYNGSTHLIKTTNFTEYKTWEGSNLLLMVIDNDETNTTGNRLKKGSSPFAKWLDSTGAAVTTADYKNLSVTASFGSSVAASAGVEDAKKDVEIGDIAAKYTTSASDASLTLSKNATYIVPKMYGTPSVATKLTIQLDTAGDKYKNVQFELSYNGTQTYLPYDASTTNQCTLSLDDYVAGKIQVRVIADTENAIGMSQTLIFDLQ